MKKLSNITESIWSDIQDRSTGDTIRKEDDINHLDRKGLYDYLISHYKNTNSFERISDLPSVNIIKVPIIIKGDAYHIHFNFNTNEVYVHYATLYMVNKLLGKVSEKFSVKSDSNKGPTWYTISPKDGSKVTNQFFIDVIDFIIDNIPDPNERGVKKIVNESIWSDIQDRSSGDAIRKEDDINHLDREGLYDYLTSHYKNTDPFAPIYNSDAFDTIKVPFLIEGGSYCVYLDFKVNEVYIPFSSPYKVNGLFSKLADEFSLKCDSKTRHKWYIISPKDGSEVTNTFFIHVIDFLIDNISDFFNKGVKKIVNESIWSDIQDRSSGDTVREEDDVNNLDNEELKDYITKHYKPLNTFAIVTYAGGILGVPIIKITTQHSILYHPESKFDKICIVEDIIDNVDGLLEKLNTHFEVKENFLQGENTTGGFTLYSVSPKDGSDVTNKFFIEVLDFILDNIPYSPNYKKSIEKRS